MEKEKLIPEELTELWTKITSFFSGLAKKDDGKPKQARTIILTRQQSITAVVIAILSLLGVGVYGYITYQKHLDINSHAYELVKLENYGISITSELITIQDLLQESDKINDEFSRYQKLAEEQAKYYNMILRYLYLPSINIRKDPYTQIVDPTIMGQKYLESDPFQDIPLIQYRSDFFKNVREGAENNEVMSIRIGEIDDIDGTHFIVPVEITFISPTKRSFLFLVNKLSTTSDQNNISLLNEFFFYLIKNIKEFKQDEIATLAQSYQRPHSLDNEKDNADFIIGYHLYQRIKYNTENILIDDNIINTTIRENVLCDETRNNNECFYLFRSKYRNLPALAYTIGINSTRDKVEDLEAFLKNLAPIIAITNFNFAKVIPTGFLTQNNQQYQGTVAFNAYGRSMSHSDVDEIAETLWALCFGKDDKWTAVSLTLALAMEKVEHSLLQLGSDLQLSNYINNLEELQQIFINIQKEYGELNNYRRSIKLFEIFRMLKDENLCNT